MDQLLAVSEDQDIDFLYSLIRQDPDFFEAFDKKRFADTPMHFAAGEGRTALALEIQRLMPSFGMKLNPDGFSPLDLAMRRGHTDTVIAMVKMNSELVHVQGREGFTPLHYAAEIDDVNILAMFLDCCPESIEALTIHGESAVHVAVQNGKLAAFRVLFGWLKRTDRTGVLLWRDFNGNNVLQLAASTNQPKIMELLIEDIPINIMNEKGLTALDMVMELPREVSGVALQIIRRKRGKTGSHFTNHTAQTMSSFASYLSSPVTIFEKLAKFHVYLDIDLPAEMRNAVLVVAGLIATATYQTMLSPPSGVNDLTPAVFNITGAPPTLNGSFTVTKITSSKGLDQGKIEALNFISFAYQNAMVFTFSLAMILLVIPSTQPYNCFLYFMLLFFMISYSQAMTNLSPLDSSPVDPLSSFLCYFLLIVIMVIKTVLLLMKVELQGPSQGNKNVASQKMAG